MFVEARQLGVLFLVEVRWTLDAALEGQDMDDEAWIAA
jgi:hypothetical protein